MTKVVVKDVNEHWSFDPSLVLNLLRYFTTSELFHIQEKVSNEMIQCGNLKSAKTKTALTSGKK